ncbi:MAG: hypothetical protein ACERKV_05520 [Clostridiaceae bacterium]
MKKKLMLIMSMIFIILILFPKTNSYGFNNKDIISDIICFSKGDVKESGLKINFKESSGLEYCDKKLISIESYYNETFKRTVIKNQDFYCLEFASDSISGYIEYIYETNTYSLKIESKDKKYGIQELKKSIFNIMNDKSEITSYYTYVKARIFNEDIDKLNRGIIEYCKSRSAENIESISIGNGYSTVMNIEDENLKNQKAYDNGKKINLNYALCSYKSGDYLIIGSPIIEITY